MIIINYISFITTLNIVIDIPWTFVLLCQQYTIMMMMMIITVMNENIRIQDEVTQSPHVTSTVMQSNVGVARPFNQHWNWNVMCHAGHITCITKIDMAAFRSHELPKLSFTLFFLLLIAAIM